MIKVITNYKGKIYYNKKYRDCVKLRKVVFKKISNLGFDTVSLNKMFKTFLNMSWAAVKKLKISNLTNIDKKQCSASGAHLDRCKMSIVSDMPSVLEK